MIERDGKSFTVRPEKVRLVNGDGADGLQTERGTVAEVAYAGPITRFFVELEKGGRLQAVRQNLDSSPGDDLERKGQEITVGWLPEHTVAVEQSKTRGGEMSAKPKHPARLAWIIVAVAARVRIRIRMRRRR